MKTSIIIPNWNTLFYLKKCVDSIKRNTRVDYELIIVDNGSTEKGTKEYILGVADKYIFNKTNLGFSKSNNLGAECANGDLLCFLNSDTVVTEGWLSNMIETMSKHRKCVAVGPLGNVKERNEGNMVFHHQQYPGQYEKDTGVYFLVGYCILIKKDIFDKILWDEDFRFGTYEDNLLCLTLKKLGYELWISANSLVYHDNPGRSFRKNNLDYMKVMEENKKIFEKKWELLKKK